MLFLLEILGHRKKGKLTRKISKGPLINHVALGKWSSLPGKQVAVNFHQLYP